MDWTTPLRCQQVDFIKRLKVNEAILSHLQNYEVRGYHSELTVISGAELKAIDEFCWHMVDRYKSQCPSSEIYINNMKGKLGELVIEKYLDQLVTPIDLKKKTEGDGGVDFRLNSDPNVCLQIKARHASVDSVRWSISKQEIEKNNVLVCVLIQEEINQRQDQYHLVLAGFLPTDLIKDAIQKRALEIRGGRAFLSINDLLYSGGLQAYLEFLEFAELEEKQSARSAHQSKSVLSSASPISAITIGSWKHEFSLEELLDLENAITQLKELSFENSIEQIKEICQSIGSQAQDSDSQLDPLEDLWQQVLSAIELRGTKALVGQQCYLMDFSNSDALVAVRSQALLKIVQRSLPLIKEAFEKCLGGSIEVLLVVIDPKTNASK